MAGVVELSEDARMSPRTTDLHTLSRCPRGRTGQHNQRRMVVAMAAEGAMGRAHLAPADTVHYPGRTPAPRRPGPHPRVHKSQRPDTRRKKRGRGGRGRGGGSEARSVRLQSSVGRESSRIRVAAPQSRKGTRPRKLPQHRRVGPPCARNTPQSAGEARSDRRRWASRGWPCRSR